MKAERLGDGGEKIPDFRCRLERSGNPAAAGMLDTEKKERVTWGLGEGGIMRDGETWREGEIRVASFLVW